MKKVIVGMVILSFVSILGLEAKTYSSEKVSLSDKRLQIISTNTPRLYLYDLELDAGCTHKIPVLLFSGNQKNPLAKEIYSMLLSAKASGKQVRIQSEQCWSDYSTPVIKSMYIY